MRIAITFRDQPEHEDCDNEQGYSLFGGSEAKSLPHFIQFETAFFNHEYFCAASLCLLCDFSGDCSFCRGRTKSER